MARVYRHPTKAQSELQLDMSYILRGQIARSSGWDGVHWQTRTEIEPERVCIDLHGSPLADLFWYWQERSMLENSVPSVESFRFPGENLPWVELDSEDPMQFMLRNHPGNPATGDWSDTRLIEHPVQMHAQSCAFEYLDCKGRQTPTFVHIEQKILGVQRTYVKLTVPVANKQGAIARAFYAVKLIGYQVIYGGLSSPA